MRLFLERFLQADLWLFNEIVRPFEDRAVSRFFRWMSKSADGYLYPLIPAVLFLAGSHSAFPFLIAATIAFAVELPAYRLVKDSVKRFRPSEKLQGVRMRIAPPDRFSFPSGHTAAAWIVAMLLSHFFPEYSLALFSWASLVGVSRVHLAVHFPTDVLAGAVLGILSAWVGLLAL